MARTIVVLPQGSGNFTVPANVQSLEAHLGGPGGRGIAAGTNNQRRGGGAGAAIGVSIPVTQGEIFNYEVPAAGSQSTAIFQSNSGDFRYATADFGRNPAPNTNTAASGGQASSNNSSGATLLYSYSGGSGGSALASGGGASGGGGGAGPNGDGRSGGASGGSQAAGGGGGANGGASTAGVAGSNGRGGDGGAGRAGNGGGSGAVNTGPISATAGVNGGGGGGGSNIGASGNVGRAPSAGGVDAVWIDSISGIAVGPSGGMGGSAPGSPAPVAGAGYCGGGGGCDSTSTPGTGYPGYIVVIYDASVANYAFAVSTTVSGAASFLQKLAKSVKINATASASVVAIRAKSLFKFVVTTVLSGAFLIKRNTLVKNVLANSQAIASLTVKSVTSRLINSIVNGFASLSKQSVASKNINSSVSSRPIVKFGRSIKLEIYTIADTIVDLFTDLTGLVRKILTKGFFLAAEVRKFNVSAENRSFTLTAKANQVLRFPSKYPREVVNASINMRPLLSNGEIIIGTPTVTTVVGDVVVSSVDIIGSDVVFTLSGGTTASRLDQQIRVECMTDGGQTRDQFVTVPIRNS